MPLNNKLLETERILLENVMLCLFQCLHSPLTGISGSCWRQSTGRDGQLVWLRTCLPLQSSANNPLNFTGGRYFWLGFFSGIAGQRPKWNTENEEQKFFCKVLIFFFSKLHIPRCMGSLNSACFPISSCLFSLFNLKWPNHLESPGFL